MLKKESDKLFKDINESRDFIKSLIEKNREIIARNETSIVPNHMEAEIAKIENTKLGTIIDVLSLCEQHLDIYLNPSPS
jgi:hypothetical protein